MGQGAQNMNTKHGTEIKGNTVKYMEIGGDSWKFIEIHRRK